MVEQEIGKVLAIALRSGFRAPMVEVDRVHAVQDGGSAPVGKTPKLSGEVCPGRGHTPSALRTLREREDGLRVQRRVLDQLFAAPEQSAGQLGRVGQDGVDQGQGLLPAAGTLGPRHIFRQPMVGLRAEDDVDIWGAAQQFGAIRLGDAAGDGQYEVSPGSPAARLQ